MAVRFSYAAEDSRHTRLNITCCRCGKEVSLILENSGDIKFLTCPHCNQALIGGTNSNEVGVHKLASEVFSRALSLASRNKITSDRGVVSKNNFTHFLVAQSWW